MLSSLDIEEICYNLDLPIIGVFSKNQLPQKHQVGSYYINMEDFEDGNGTHWVMCKIFKDGNALYFDSFGMREPIEVSDFLKPFKPYAYNHRVIQDLTSIRCGLFCIACDLYMQKHYNKNKDFGDNYDDFINLFSANKKSNDKILNELLKNKL